MFEDRSLGGISPGGVLFRRRSTWGKWIYTRLPYFIRKKLDQQTALKWLIVSLVALVVLLVIEIVILVRLWQTGHIFSTRSQVKDSLSSDSSLIKPEIEPAQAQINEIIAPRAPGRGKASISRIFGLPQSEFKYFLPDETGQFTCYKSEHVVKIPFDQVNDDYCDCPDGSDEPSTGACPGTKFVCSEGDQGKWLPSSRINDGVCDCCDGSDEHDGNLNPFDKTLDLKEQKRLGRYQSPCPNTC